MIGKGLFSWGNRAGAEPPPNDSRLVSDLEAQTLVESLEKLDAYPPSPSPEELATESEVTSLPVPPQGAQINLMVPYVHQMWDTPDEFDGRWACGPASAAMMLAYYRQLEPRAITVSHPSRHQNDFGWYVSNPFTHEGMSFDTRATTKNGRVAQGLYGKIVHRGLAQASVRVGAQLKGLLIVLRHFMEPLGNKVELIARPTRQDVVNSLEEGHPVILSGHVFGYAHLLVIRGYHYHAPTDVYHWIVNDPHGYRNRGRWDGHNVAYRWTELYYPSGAPSKYMYRIRGSTRP